MSMHRMPQRIHAYLRGARRALQGETRSADTPAKTNKEYARMPRMVLPRPSPLPVSLDSALESRTSHFSGNKEILPRDFSTLLYHALGARKDRTRRYPSAGALYPIETYIVALSLSGIPRALFHYHQHAHTLEHLWDVPSDFDPRAFAPTARGASAFLLFTAVWERTAAKYGDFGYLHAVIEAGHMAQNVLLVASALKIAACPLGGFDEKIAASILDLDNETEQPMYAIALQRTASDQKERSQ